MITIKFFSKITFDILNIIKNTKKSKKFNEIILYNLKYSLTLPNKQFQIWKKKRGTNSSIIKVR